MLTKEQNTLRRNITKAFIKASDTIYKQRMYITELEDIAQSFIGNGCRREILNFSSIITRTWIFYLNNIRLCHISISVNQEAQTAYICSIECDQYQMNFLSHMYFRCTYKPSDTRDPLVPQERELWCSNGVLSGTKPNIFEYRDSNGRVFSKYVSYKDTRDAFGSLPRYMKAFEYTMRTGDTV